MKTKTRKRPIKDDALGLNDGDGPGSYATDLIFAFEKQLARRGTVDAEDEDEVGREDEAADGHTVGATPHRGPSIGGSSKERAHTEGTKLISDSAAARGSFTTLNTQQELIALLKARWDILVHAMSTEPNASGSHWKPTSLRWTGSASREKERHCFWKSNDSRSNF
jgi:hypothetical protein